MTLVGARKFTYFFSGTLFLISAVLFFTWGLKLGIDFTGGTLMEIEYQVARPPLEAIEKAVTSAGADHLRVQPTGDSGFFIRLKNITEDEHRKIVRALPGAGTSEVVEKRFETIGPTIGNELKTKSILSVLVVIALIVLYIAWAFRKVSEPVASWKYGVATVVALVHDVMIPVGVFTALGHFLGVEVDTLFVTALLTVLGFSVHDTIVVFDRIRENLKNAKGKIDFEAIVEKSIRQTFTRSVNTSFTVLLVLLAIFFFGGRTVEYFALTLIVGIAFGTYSSIFLASPILVTWHKLRAKA